MWAEKGGGKVDAKLKQDLNWFFSVFQNRTSDLLDPLPASQRQELDDELELLRVSILNRLAQELGR